MKVFQLEATPRTDLGKKAAKALRGSKNIPAVLNGGELVDLPYAGTLKAGEKVGKAVYIVDCKEIARVDIVTTFEVKALHEDDKGFFSKLWDSILKLFK